MDRRWENEGWVLELRGNTRGTRWELALARRGHERPPAVTKRYDYWQGQDAEREALALAEAVGLEEVPWNEVAA